MITTPFLPVPTVASPGARRSALLLLILALVITGCHRTEIPSDTAAALPTVPVQVQTIVRESRPAIEDVVGTVRPKLSASIEAKISGRLAEMLVVPGQSVTNGQLLVRLDAAEIASRANQANAALKQAEHDWQRISLLLQQQAASHSDYDAADARYRMA